LAAGLWGSASVAAQSPRSSDEAASAQRSIPVAESVTPLTQIRDVRQLSAEQAARSLPVHAVGVVTAKSGYARSFFLQDGTAGIDVESNPDRTPEVGDLVDLTGTTGPGHFAPIVVASHVRIVGQAPPPDARRVQLSDMLGGEQDSQWIEVQGIVHSARLSDVYRNQELVLSLDLGGGTMRVLLQQFNARDAEKLIDATVRFRGVCISDFNEKRQFVGLGLIVPSRADVEIVEPAVADPLAGPSTPIRKALGFGQARHRIKTEGVVTYQSPGRFLYLQQGGDGIQVRSASTEIIELGKRVEAVGFPILGEYAPVLSDGLWRVVGDAAPIKPVWIEADKVINRPGEFTHVDHGDQLVQLQGEVVEVRLQGGQRIWRLGHKGTVFDADLPANFLDKHLGDLGAGSVLQVTGICAVHVDFDRNPISFSILMRTPGDIVVLRRPSWWTAQHMLILIAALAASVLVLGGGGALWVAMLRIRVKQQTQTILESEEKFRYMASHDGLTQLLNRNFVLATLAESLEQARSRKSGVGVAIVDLDHFKSINDSYGHRAGDEVLRQAAHRLAGAIRENDAIGRYGGEEFLIIFKDVDQTIGATRCEVVRRAVCCKPVIFEGEELSISCSIGMASAQSGGVTADKLVARADDALYRAKRAGRNRVELFTPQPGALTNENLLSSG
jgi:diguanylate cyclase (GGDEF)-like protein